MNRAESERLMLYLDGELSPAEVADVERLLVESAEARAVLSDLEALGAAVRAIGLERAEATQDVTAAVMQRIAREPSGGSSPGAASNVVRFGRYWAPAAGLAIAAAAAFALYLRPAPGTSTAPSSRLAPALPPQAPAGIPAGPSSAEAAALPASGEAEAEGEGGAEIESVDFGAQSGSIFMVASGPQVTPVVWLVDESVGPGGRMKPL